MFEHLPSTIKRALMIVRLLSQKSSIKIMQGIIYLWREFYIKTKLEIEVSKIKAEFFVKDKKILSTELKDIDKLIKIIDKLKEKRGDNNDKEEDL